MKKHAARSAARRASSAGPASGAARTGPVPTTMERTGEARRRRTTRPEVRRPPSTRRLSDSAQSAPRSDRRNGNRCRPPRRRPCHAIPVTGRSNYDRLTSYCSRHSRRPIHRSTRRHPIRSRHSRPGGHRRRTRMTAAAYRRPRPPGSARRSAALAGFAAHHASSTPGNRNAIRGLLVSTIRITRYAG